MNLFWMGEACDLPPEPETGTAVTRLTASAMSNINIYCEQPYTSPDGRRIAILRSPYADPRHPPSELCVIDLVTLRIVLVESRVTSTMVATSAYSGLIHYLDGRGVVQRLDIATLKRDEVFAWPLPRPMGFDSATPDGRYLIGGMPEPDFHTAIMRVDLGTGRAERIFRHPEIVNHLQVNPVTGRDILVQLNRGIGRNPDGETRPVASPLRGATHFVIDIDGGNRRDLAIGEPHTSGTTGHSAWVAGTGRVGVSTAYAWADARTPGGLDPRHPEGNFFTVAPGEATPVPFAAPNHRFNHVSVSRDGRYFVCDCYRRGLPGRIALVIGNIATGKHRTLLWDCGAQGGCAACSHPHPYLTADNRRVIFNSDRTGVCHVHAAHVTPEFLASLD